MTPEIKHRIEQIQNGNIPDGYKKLNISNYIVPTDWSEIHMDNLFKRLTRKNTVRNTNVLTISAQHGLINQQDFFNKTVASEDKSNYFLLQKGDFAYNKSYSTGYPFGAVKVLEKYESGIVSPLYICFEKTEKNKCSDYYLHYFEGGFANREIRAFAQEGARNHGLLNIATEDFFNMSLVFPSLPEQLKISKILSTQDKVIALKQNLLQEKKKQKKFLMQKLLGADGASFMLDDVKIDKSKWKKEKLGNVCIFLDSKRKPVRFNERCKGKYPYYGASGIIDYVDDYIFDGEYVLLGEDGANIIFRSSPLAFKVSGKMWINNHAHVLQLKENYDIDYITNYLESLDYEKYNSGTAQPKLNQEVCESIIILIPSLPEQQVIAKVLSAADKEIELLQKSIEQEKQKKKALMQLLLTGIVRVKI